MLLLLITIINIWINMVQARTFSVDKAALYSKGVCKSLLKNNNTGGTIIVTKVFYKNPSNSKEYPAYCLNVELDGVDSDSGYSVEVSKLVTDEEIRRAIINGYPYKTLDELGVENVDEAFTATKMAVYCILYDYDKDNFAKFSGIGDAGERTLKAMKKIVNAARKGTDKQEDPKIYIEEKSKDWKIDESDKNYISKTYVVKANKNIEEFKLKIENNEIEGIRITDLEGNKKTTFKEGSEFKIQVPLKDINEKGSFDINIEGKIDTKPILYGKAPDSKHQNYALTGISYETDTDKLSDEYPKNDTTITFEKLSKSNNETLKGAKFNVYDENKKLVYKDLVTDENGLIRIEGILPGKYFLQEVEAPKGYEKYDELIEFNIDYQEEKILSITNNKIKVATREKVTRKLPVTGY